MLNGIMRKQPVSVIILTLNEEENLPAAIESALGWAAQIFVVDSCSTDKTVDVAMRYNVQLVQRRFTNFGEQWNWALDRLPIETPWVMKLDADERLPANLKMELGSIIERDPAENGFVIPVRLWFMGRRLHSEIRVVRFWRHHKARFSQVVVNEHLLVEGAVGKTRSWIEHVDTPALHRWYAKQNRYSTMEAMMRARGDTLSAEPKLFGSVLQRRMFLKRAFFHLPFRYHVLYLYHLVILNAWRDGKEGWAWARLRTEVYRAIDLKTREILNTGRFPEMPAVADGDVDPRVSRTDLQQRVTEAETELRTHGGRDCYAS